MKEPRRLTSASVRMDGGVIKGIKGAVTTKLTHPMRLKVSAERQSALLKI